jgi:DNA-binding GntR family transcriptional regulator
MAQALNRRIEATGRTSAKIKRGTPLYEQIYDALWKLIFEGEISAGQRLSDREWALRLSTSRTPAREAMRQMARDGILVALENGGYQVRNADPEGLAQLYRCRAPLAALAACDTTRIGDEQLFKQIKGVVENTRKAVATRDANGALKLNSKFHSLVVENCGNPYLVITMSNLERLILFYRITLLKTSGENRGHNDEYFEHLVRGNKRQLQIANAMIKGNAQQAGSLMEQHLLASAEDMARLLKTDGL